MLLASSLSLIGKSILISSLLCPIATGVVYYEKGLSGAYGVILGFGLAIINFAVAAYLILRCMDRETNSMAAVILPGFLIRLPLMLGVIYYFTKVSWVNIYVLIGSFIAIYSCFLFVELKLIDDLAKSSKLEIRKG